MGSESWLHRSGHPGVDRPIRSQPFPQPSHTAPRRSRGLQQERLSSRAQPAGDFGRNVPILGWTQPEPSGADRAAKESRYPVIALVNFAKASSLASAAPESMDSAAAGRACWRESKRPDATSAAAAFNKTTSRLADFSPRRIFRTITALVAASPPAMALSGDRFRPNSSGVTS